MFATEFYYIYNVCNHIMVYISATLYFYKQTLPKSTSEYAINTYIFSYDLVTPDPFHLSDLEEDQEVEGSGRCSIILL